MLDDPLQVLRLQVGDAHMAYHTFPFQFNQSGQGLVADLLQTTLHASLEFNVVDVDQVDIVYVQALHALIHTLCGPFGAVVPGVHTVLPVASHFRGEVIFVTGDFLQGLAQHRLCLQVSIVGRHVDEVDAVIHGHMHGTDALFLMDAVEHTTQRRGAKTEVRHPHASLSNFVVYHIDYY